ncbi:hypothetical protein, partial [uncultured Jannaschia sp.]|uniref:hypothetical protein n=1 Tax=uncultured Jannaschia sp. TaxID=293347 RepID=UPI00262BA034
MKSVLSTLLVGTALTVPFAAPAQQTSLEEACANLQAALTSELPEGADEAQVTQIVETGDVEACRVEYERLFVAQDQSDQAQSETSATVAETESVTLTLQDEVTIQGRVLLDQTPPRVDIEESPAEVEI